MELGYAWVMQSSCALPSWSMWVFSIQSIHIISHLSGPFWAKLYTLSHACFATCSPTPELQFEGIALMLKQSLFERLLSGKLLGLTVQRAAIKALSQIFWFSIARLIRSVWRHRQTHWHRGYAMPQHTNEIKWNRMNTSWYNVTYVKTISATLCNVTGWILLWATGAVNGPAVLLLFCCRIAHQFEVAHVS